MTTAAFLPWSAISAGSGWPDHPWKSGPLGGTVLAMSVMVMVVSDRIEPPTFRFWPRAETYGVPLGSRACRSWPDSHTAKKASGQPQRVTK